MAALERCVCPALKLGSLFHCIRWKVFIVILGFQSLQRQKEDRKSQVFVFQRTVERLSVIIWPYFKKCTFERDRPAPTWVS